MVELALRGFGVIDFLFVDFDLVGDVPRLAEHITYQKFLDKARGVPD